MAMFVLRKTKPIGQIYERESELGESGSTESSTLFINITH